MTMTLSVLRCPDAGPARDQAEVKGGEFSIGRGPDNDWTLADPDRVLHRKRHWRCWRSRSGGLATRRYEHQAAPSPPTAISEPVGAGEPRDLRDGDRLRLGNYEIEIRIEEDIQPSWNRDAPSAGAARGGPASAFSDPFGDDPFAPGAAPQHGFGRDPLLGAPPGQGIGQQGVQLPADYDPLAPDAFDAPFTGPTQSDHAPGIGHSFRLPASPIPDDDWDIESPHRRLLRHRSSGRRRRRLPAAIPDPFDESPIVPLMAPAAAMPPMAPTARTAPVQADPFAADPFAEAPPACAGVATGGGADPGGSDFRRLRFRWRSISVIEPAAHSPFAEPSDRPPPAAVTAAPPPAPVAHFGRPT